MKVTPHVGVWIETIKDIICDCGGLVTPHVGVWIETTSLSIPIPHTRVTPHVGVWIETKSERKTQNQMKGHTSCRCVD